MGEATPRRREINEVVWQAAGLVHVGASASGEQVYGAAREIIVAAGYGAHFGQSLEHGINEDPSLDM